MMQLDIGKLRTQLILLFKLTEKKMQSEHVFKCLKTKINLVSHH